MEDRENEINIMKNAENTLQARGDQQVILEQRELVDGLHTLYKEYENKTKTYGVFSDQIDQIDSDFASKIPIIPPEDLESVLQGFLEKYKEEYKEERPFYLGLFISDILRKTTNRYIEESKAKGIEEKDIPPLVVRLDLTGFKKPLNYLGYKNPNGLHLILEGNCGEFTGCSMNGGEIVVYGNCGDNTGCSMNGGEIVVYGNCGDNTGASMEGGRIKVKRNAGRGTGYLMNGGEIVVYGDCGDHTGASMEGGRIKVKRNAGRGTGYLMNGGEIVVYGDCGDNTGAFMNGGRIEVNGNCGDHTGASMEGGRIKVGGNAGRGTGYSMKGGIIHVRRKILGGIDPSALSLLNKGRLIEGENVVYNGARK